MKERSTAWVSVKLLGKNGGTEVPSAVTYRVDCLTNQTNLRPFTPITPAADFEVELGADETQVLNRANATETKRVTISAIFATQQDRIVETFDFKVERVDTLL